MKVRKVANKDAIILDIRNALSCCEDAKFYHRLDLVMLAINGTPIKEIESLYNEPAKTISTWTKKVIENGVDSLKPGDHPGRPSRLTETQIKRLDADLQRKPENFGYDINSWDGIILSRHLKDHYGVSLHVRQCQRVLRQLGYTLQRPQTKPYGGNPAEQAEF
ncbi:MAG: helix-turn-helix domain-containing protein [Clostridia bacterium]